MSKFVSNGISILNGLSEKSIGKCCKKGLIEAASLPVVVWDRRIPNTKLEKLQRIIEKKYNKHFDSYWDFHKWSITNFPEFWREVWNFCEIICSKSYDKVFMKTGPGFLDNEWFIGTRYNYAENLLRERSNRTAIIYIDELGIEESVTFAEMFEEVKLYAAAFRKCGLKVGDTVACYMSHRKEAIFAMLAVTSIGAIWGGPAPYHGGRFASNIVNMMGAKFLISCDFFTDTNMPEYMLEKLPIVAGNCPTLEKIILVATQAKSYNKDLSNIRNCIFLEDFLKKGRNPDGTVPDITFEQLPFNHPVTINFTSGTTGSPKAPVHTAGILVTIMKDFSIHMNMKSGDTACGLYSVGWSLWDYFTSSLALGVTNLLYCSSVFTLHNGKNFWDMMAKYNVNMTFMANNDVEKMHKMGIKPSPNSKLDCLKLIGIVGTPVKKESFEYLKEKVKSDMFVGSSYGATEVLGTFSGFNLNMPVYAGEIQVPSLGVDIKCFDETGNSIIGERGELVVCTPAPIFTKNLWNDENNIMLKETYLTKYPGVWCQNDHCWINPKTNGLIVIGRSDDVLKQNTERFTSGDIYFAIHAMEELEDYICVSQQNDNGDTRAVLFVKMRKDLKFTPEIETKIRNVIDTELTDSFTPECILGVVDIPYNVNNKRMESIVRKIINTNKIPEVMNIRNPESLKYYLNIPEILKYNQI